MEIDFSDNPDKRLSIPQHIQDAFAKSLEKSRRQAIERLLDPRYSDPKFSQPPKKPYIRRDSITGDHLHLGQNKEGAVITTSSSPTVFLDFILHCTLFRSEAEQVGNKLLSIHECHLHQVVVTWLE